MDIKKYEGLRKKVMEHGFESKYKNLDKWLFGSSFFGNVGSIFFAYFLVFPALNKAITSNLTSGGFGLLLGISATIIILALFEYIKRIVLTNLSFDIVKKDVAKSILWLVFSIGIIGASSWLSIKGAVNFASTSNKYNVVMDSTYQSKLDSITPDFDTKIQQIRVDNDTLRSKNDKLRQLLIETPLNYVNTRKEYNKIINDNLSVIESNDNKVSTLEKELANIRSDLDDEKQFMISEYKMNVESDQTLFFIIAFSIELIIILGIYFREYYDFHIYLIHEKDLEEIYRKINNFKLLLKFIYKNGDVGIGDGIISAAKLKEIVKDSANIPTPNKFIDIFINEITYMGIIRLEGRRRFANVSFADAIIKVEDFDKNTKILEQLK